jgi:hypothetical protein
MITLAQLEQEVARRTGPFFQAAQDSGVPTSSTATSAIMPRLKSNALLGGPENLWLVRRGLLADGTPTAVDPADRERMIQTFDASAGRVIVDANWRNPMTPNELADFTHLHPSQELRVAVLAGLRRCFLEDVEEVDPNLQYGPIDVTAQLPWVTDPRQVLGVQYGWLQPCGTAPFDVTMQQGHVLLGGAWGNAAATSVWVTFRRPAWSIVNDLDSTTGPTDDEDELMVDLDYAASAGHIEAWHLFPSRMFAAAAGNLQATQEMAAREFTRQAMMWAPQVERSVSFSSVVSLPLVG